MQTLAANPNASCDNNLLNRERFADYWRGLKPDMQEDSEEFVTRLFRLLGENPCFCTGKLSNKRTLLSYAPEVLVCYVTRFTFVPFEAGGGTSSKMKAALEFPERLTLGPPLSDDPHLKIDYELSSYVRHHGDSLERGHYVAVIRSGSTWFEMNDERVTRKSAEAVRREIDGSEIDGSDRVYLMVYSRVKKPTA
ncbi:hypothetical protein RQP46_003621 [Phenoliferia psychrophenolica]